MAKLTLGKRERLKSRKLIDQLFKEGRSFTVYPFRVFYLYHPRTASGPASEALQFGVGVSTRNFKHAVDRNRIKRLTREAYRLQKAPLQALLNERQQHFACFLIYTGKELPVFELVNGKIGVILNRLIKAAHEIPSPVA